jgi:acetolactate synthase-1/2/3 large subunit
LTGTGKKTEILSTRIPVSCYPFEEVVEGFGAKGLLLKDEASLLDMLEQAREINKQGQPVLVNAFIDRTDFRKGSIFI